MHTTQLHNASASLCQCERQPLSKTALAQEFAFHLDRICSIKRVDTVDIAKLLMQNTYLWAADRNDFASAPTLVLQKALNIVPKVVEAYE